MNNLTPEERLEIMKSAKIEFVDKKDYVKGGQHVGMVMRDCLLTHDEMNFEIRIGYHRSQSANRDICIQLFDLFLSSL